MRHVISILLQNEAGALARVASLFSTRGYNIESLSVAPTEDPQVSRLTLVTIGSDQVISQITQQLFKLVEVVKISELDPRRSVERELMIATVKAGTEERSHVAELVNIFEGKILAVAETVMTVSLEGHPDKLDDFVELLGGYGIVELQRTGRVALPKLDRGACLRAVTNQQGKAG